MTSQRDVPTVPDNSLAAFVTNALPEGDMKGMSFGDHKVDDNTLGDDSNGELKKQEISLINVSLNLWRECHTYLLWTLDWANVVFRVLCLFSLPVRGGKCAVFSCGPSCIVFNVLFVHVFQFCNQRNESEFHVLLTCGPVSSKQGSLFFQNCLPNVTNGLMNLRNQDSSFPEPIGKGRSSSIGSSNGLERSRSLSGTGSSGGLESRTRSLSGASSSGEYGRAPGSEREDIHVSIAPPACYILCVQFSNDTFKVPQMPESLHAPASSNYREVK